MGKLVRGKQGTQGMFTRIEGKLLEDSGEWYHFKIPRNVEKDSGECWRRFQEMLGKILGNAQKDSREF